MDEEIKDYCCEVCGKVKPGKPYASNWAAAICSEECYKVFLGLPTPKI